MQVGWVFCCSMFIRITAACAEAGGISEHRASHCCALAGFHVACCLVCRSEEFTSNGKIFVGGFEAYNAMCLQGNPAGIHLVVDCTRSSWEAPRGKGSSFRSQHIQKVPDPLPVGVREVFLGMNTVLGNRRLLRPVMGEAFEAVFAALAAGQNVLFFCMNGCHRSPVSQFMSFIGRSQSAHEHVGRTMFRAYVLFWF